MENDVRISTTARDHDDPSYQSATEALAAFERLVFPCALDLASSAIVDCSADPALEHDRQDEAAYLAVVFQRAMRRVEPRQWAVWVICEVHGHSYRETARHPRVDVGKSQVGTFVKRVAGVIETILSEDGALKPRDHDEPRADWHGGNGE
jgi:DNA-directed RNA polymerase specialized sigma24 family protein